MGARAITAARSHALAPADGQHVPVAFNSPTQIALNVLGLALWLVVTGDAIRRWRSKRPVSTGQFFAICVGWWIGGVLVPAGPAMWLLWRALHTRMVEFDGQASVPAVRLGHVHNCRSVAREDGSDRPLWGRGR